ncbi:MAG: Ig-like domain-containing protein, partial [Thermoplasmata archaeon]
SPPTITVLSPSNGSKYKPGNITFQGRVSDNKGIDIMKIYREGQESSPYLPTLVLVTNTSSLKTYSFSYTTQIQAPGQYRFVFEARDYYYNPAIVYVNLTIDNSVQQDTRPPVFTIDEPSSDRVVEGTVRFAGYVSDSEHNFMLL